MYKEKPPQNEKTIFEFENLKDELIEKGYDYDFIKKLAFKRYFLSKNYYKNTIYGVEDFFQAGLIGYSKAKKTYDPNKKKKMSGWAYWYMIKEMIVLNEHGKRKRVSTIPITNFMENFDKKDEGLLDFWSKKDYTNENFITKEALKKQLNEREYDVFTKRYNLFGEWESCNDLAEKWNTTPQNITAINYRVKQKLRKKWS